MVEGANPVNAYQNCMWVMVHESPEEQRRTICACPRRQGELIWCRRLCEVLRELLRDSSCYQSSEHVSGRYSSHAPVWFLQCREFAEAQRSVNIFGVVDAPSLTVPALPPMVFSRPFLL